MEYDEPITLLLEYYIACMLTLSNAAQSAPFLTSILINDPRSPRTAICNGVLPSYAYPLVTILS